MPHVYPENEVNHYISLAQRHGIPLPPSIQWYLSQGFSIPTHLAEPQGFAREMQQRSGNLQRERAERERVQREISERAERERIAIIENSRSHQSSVEEARALENILYGHVNTPDFGSHNIEWWSNPQNVEGYLGDLRGQVDLRQRRSEQMASSENNMRLLLDRARRLEYETYGKYNTPEWGQHNRAWWNVPGNAESYLSDLENNMYHRRYEAERENMLRASESSVKRSNERSQETDMIWIKNNISRYKEDINILNSLSGLVENNCATADERERCEAANLRMMEFTSGEEGTNLSRRLEYVVNHWFEIQEEAREKSQQPGKFKNEFMLHYHKLRMSALRNLDVHLCDENEKEAKERAMQIRRVFFEEARGLEAQLGQSSTPVWEERDEQWWNDRDNVKGYVMDLREQVDLKRQFDEARQLEAQLYQSNTPPWGEHDRVWWGNRDNVEGYLGDLRHRASLRL